MMMMMIKENNGTLDWSVIFLAYLTYFEKK
jgi:hypothetical protein